MNQTETGLNPMQMEAVEYTEGPLLILAGAGSGKTRVLTHRIASLIREKGVNPWNIMAITFTNKAAGEMRERVDKIVGYGSERIWVSTFHSSCVRILRRHAERLGYANNFAIYDTDDQKSLIKDIMKRLQMDPKLYRDRAIMAAISSAKDEMIEPDQYRIDAGIDWKLQKYAAVYAEYQAELKKNNAMDFDDLLVQTVKLFQQFPEVLDYYQEQFRYIMVDEYQDTNTVQFRFVSLLAAKYRNLCVVGDDDQSIYRFRGAKPEIMLHFKDDYPEAETVLLDVNYRSVKNIVTSAGYLIGHNKERFQKKIEAADQGDIPVEWQLFESQRKENARIIWDIQEAVEKGAKYEEFAVLFRTNTQPRLLMEQLMEYNIPFRTRDTVPNLYEHWIAKDIFAYIRIALGSRERRDFLQIMNRPKRYISRESLDEETVAFDVWEWYYEEQPWVAKRIEKLEGDIRMLERLSPYAAINYIRKAIGYDEFCTEYADYRRIKADDLFDVLDELLDAAREYKTYDAWFDHIENYTKELQEFYRVQNQNPNSVALATLHSAKGLEYENVYIIDVNEGVMPYKKAVLEPEVEEERRMFYVGMTRAKKNLHLFSVRQLNHKDAEISRFIKEAQPPEKKKD